MKKLLVLVTLVVLLGGCHFASENCQSNASGNLRDAPGHGAPPRWWATPPGSNAGYSSDSHY